ncbi:IPT/TIG domain-containing protein [Streptomyces niveus]|uniref:IPT/TIG domain-containing protein n=1 Tax=Streptomyces niveus TaxID=193462 RepID=UPI0036B93697
MEPAFGCAGRQVVITGTNFAATDAVVRFGGGTVAEVTDRTDTSLTVQVPAGAADWPAGGRHPRR